MGWRERVTRFLGGVPASEVSQIVGSARADVDALSLRLAAAREKAKMASGVAITNGQFQYDVAEALRGKERWTTFAKMETDAHVAGSVSGIVDPLKGAKWEIKPATDKPKDLEIAEFVSANLLRTNGEKYGREYWCASSWRAQRLPEILQMLWHGFSLFAKSWREVNGKLVYDRIQWLEPSSVDPRGWILDNSDNLVSVQRTFRKPDSNAVLQEPIAAADLALYVWDMRGARYAGTPFVRAMYGPWMRKDFVLRQALIWAQKAGNPIPVGFYPKTGYNDRDIALFEQAVQMMRGTSPDHAFFAGPLGDDGQEPVMKYVGADSGEVDRMRGLIDGENAEIAHAGASKSQLLGETSSGSRAVGGTQQDREMMTVKAAADVVCEWETHGVGPLPGLIEELVARNFANVRSMPELRVSNVAPGEAFQNFDELVAGVNAGLIPKHPEIQRQITERFGLVIPDEVFESMEWPPQPVVVNTAKPGTPAADTPSDDSKDPQAEDPQAEDPTAKKDARQVELQMRLVDAIRLPSVKAAAYAEAPAREPLTFESEYIVLAQVSASFADGEARMLGIYRKAWSAFVAEIVAAGKSGRLSAETMEKFRRGKPKKSDEIKSALRAAFISTAYDGRKHVEDELARQMNHKVALEAVPADAALPKGKTPKPKNLPVSGFVEVLISDVAEQSTVSASVSVDEIWSRLVSEGIGEWERLRRQGLRGDALWQQLESFLDDLSDGPIKTAAREVSTVAYSAGRDLGARTALMEDKADWVVRVEVLDNAICENCLRLHALKIRIGSDQYFRLMPPARCLGRDRCRGFYFVLAAQGVSDAN